MSGGRGRRAAAWPIALLAAMLAVLTGVAPAAHAADDGSVQVVVDDVQPVVLTPGGQLTLKGHVVNTTGHAVDVTTDLRVRTTKLLYRSDITSLDTQKLPDTAVAKATDELGTVPAGASVQWQLTAKASDLGLEHSTDPGVYAMSVEARASDGSRLGIVRTLLPWWTPTSSSVATLSKLSITTLWPVVDQPHRNGTTLGDDAQTPVFTDDSLATSLAPGGRLNSVVETGREIGGVSWVVDPGLLDAARQMKDGYRLWPPGQDPAADPVHTPAKPNPKKSTTPNGVDELGDTPSKPATTSNTLSGQGGATASAWLDQLRTAIGTDGVVSLPYADPDIATVVHAQSGSNIDLRQDVTAAISRGTTVSQDILQRQVRSDVLWPYQGAVDQSILDYAKNSGTGVVIASGASMPPSSNLVYTPSARVQLSGKTSALVTDPQIDNLLAGDLTQPGAKSSAIQALTSDLLMIPLEQPDKARSLIVAPPRTLDATTADVIKQVLADAAPWTAHQSLDQLADSASDPNDAARSVQSYPHALAASEASPTYLGYVALMQKSLNTFTGILTKPERVTEPYAPAILGTLSTEWRGDPNGAETFRRLVTRSLAQIENLVYIVHKNGVTLSGNSGKIPITVVNNLQQAVNVQLQMVSHQPNRLKLGAPETITVPPGHMPVTTFPAKAAANGTVLVEVQMYTPDGSGAVGPSQTFYVDTTSIDGITVGIIAVVALLLAVFSVRAYLRRRRGGGGDDIDPDAPVTPPPPGTSADPDDDGRHARVPDTHARASDAGTGHPWSVYTPPGHGNSPHPDNPTWTRGDGHTPPGPPGERRE